MFRFEWAAPCVGPKETDLGHIGLYATPLGRTLFTRPFYRIVLRTPRCGCVSTPVTAGLLMKERRPAFLDLMPVGQD